MRLIDADAFRDYVLKGKPIGLTICQYSESDILYMIKQQPTITSTPNAPLTLEELREMDGEPVWVQSPGVPEYGSWRIVAGVDTEDGERTLFCNGDFNCRDYGKVWLAYRRKPEKGEEHGKQS